MIYESRIYKAVPGKLPNINARFANHTIGFFEEFDIGMVGFWNDEVGASNQLTYILSFDSMADREKKWAAFGAHKPWHEVRAETEKDGPLVAQVINSFMSLTSYSPEPSLQDPRCMRKACLRGHARQAARPAQPVLQPHYGTVSRSTASRTWPTGLKTWAPATAWSTCWVIPTWRPEKKAGPASNRTPTGRRQGPPPKKTGPWFGCPSTPSCA